jgi:dCTP deaminase
MTVISAQNIRSLCIGDIARANGRPLISPFVERGVANGKSYGLSACTYDCRIDQNLILGPRDAALASTMERFSIPKNVCGSVLDKSTYARVFITAFNTHLDPGWGEEMDGGCWLTIELVNLGNATVEFQNGDPVCQIKFEWLDEPTELPYHGKYSKQERGPQAARFEETK